MGWPKASGADPAQPETSIRFGPTFELRGHRNLGALRNAVQGLDVGFCAHALDWKQHG